MKHTDFVKYWREKKSNSEFLKHVPALSEKKKFKKMIEVLMNINKYGIDDIRKADYRLQIELVKLIFGDSKQQYNQAIEKETVKAINIGKKRAGI